MIQNDNEYIFTIDNDSIRALIPFDLSDEECESIANDLDSRFEDFVATAMACDFKDEALEQAESLRKTLEEVIDDDVFMYQHDNVHNTGLKEVIYNCNNAEPLVVSSHEWYDLYLSLKAAEDAVTFSITAPIQD